MSDRAYKLIGEVFQVRGSLVATMNAGLAHFHITFFYTVYSIGTELTPTGGSCSDSLVTNWPSINPSINPSIHPDFPLPLPALLTGHQGITIPVKDILSSLS